MVQPPPRIPQEKITRNKGGLFIWCANGQYAGMYPASLSEMLECSLLKAEFIIDILEDIIRTLNLDNIADISDAVFKLTQIVPDPPEDHDIQHYSKTFQEILKNEETLVTIEDISEILDITYDFAAKLYQSFKKPIIDEESLDAFLQFVDRYLIRNHNDTIPDEHRKKAEIVEDQPVKNVLKFDTKRIERILNEEAPRELRSDSFIEANKVQIQKEEQQQEEFKNNSPYFATTCKILQDLLDINTEEAELLLSSSKVLSEFLDLENLQIADAIFNDIKNGDMQSLLEAVNNKVEGIVANIADDAMKNMLDGHTDIALTKNSKENNTEDHTKQKNAIQSSLPPAIEYPDFKDLSQKALMNNTSDTTHTNQKNQSVGTQDQTTAQQAPKNTHQQTQQTKPITQPQSDNKANDDVPDNLPETLVMIYSLNNRITAKSLAKSFELFGVPISQSLARFIIEEGGYGSQPPNKHRIMNIQNVEKLISDIEESKDLKDFVKIYLEKVNNDLKSMLTGDNK